MDFDKPIVHHLDPKFKCDRISTTTKLIFRPLGTNVQLFNTRSNCNLRHTQRKYQPIKMLKIRKLSVSINFTIN